MFLITQNVKYRMIDEMNCAVVSKIPNSLSFYRYQIYREIVFKAKDMTIQLITF